MIRYCLLIIASTLMVACNYEEPVEPLDKSEPPHTHPKHTNPGLTPLEEPNEEQFYEASKTL